MNRQEAANFLNVSTRTITNYQRTGLLSTEKIGRAVVFNISELEELKNLKKELGAGQLIPKKEILELRARVSRLEAQMRVINMILDTKTGSLNLDKESAKELLTQLRTSLANYKELALTSVEAWIDIFYRVEEQDFILIKEVEGYSDSWKLFLDLCNLLIERVVEDKTYSTSIRLQSLHKALCEGRRRLRISAVIFCEREGQVPMAIRSRALSLSPKSLLAELRNTVKK